MNKILFFLLFFASFNAFCFSEKETTFEFAHTSLTKDVFPQSVNWSGTWTCENDLGLFSIIIFPEQEGIIKCTVSAEGMQLFYELDCRGRMNGNSFELYFVSTNDGVFNEEESITPEKPLLILTSSNGKVLTNWGQLTEEKSGMVCFKKTK